jgi:predicted NBD/HSP70 family sugar kinase
MSEMLLRLSSRPVVASRRYLAVDGFAANGFSAAGARPNENPVETRRAAVWCIGVDLGGTKVTAALADSGGDIRSEITEPTDPRGGMNVLGQVHELAARLLTVGHIEVTDVGGIAVGMPGVVNPGTGVVGLGHNITGLSELNVPEALSLLFERQVQVENDVNLAVLGESWKGGAQGYENVGFLSLGTGTGLGLVVNGRLVRGASGAAGEISYLPQGSDLTSRAALEVGAFELEVGSAGIVARYEASGGAHAGTVREIFERLDTDRIAAEVVGYVADKVALAIVALQAVLDLDKVILGGSIGVQPELVRRVKAAVPKFFARPVDIAASSLGSRAGLVGAVAAAAQQLRRQRRDIEDIAPVDVVRQSDLAGAAG